jgi:precorrin-6B methylase 1
MRDIVITGREMLMLSPNERYQMPDNIADQLIARGKAELISDAILMQEAKAHLAASEKLAKERCEQSALIATEEHDRKSKKGK